MPDLKPKIVEPFRCSFCGKDQHQVRRLIAGISGFICEDCVRLCADIEQAAEAEQRLLADGKRIVSAADAERLAWMKTWTVAAEGGADA